MNENIPEEIECPQDGCGRAAALVEEDYYECNCGWFGKDILGEWQNAINRLKLQVKGLIWELKNAQDLLYDCGYYSCKTCFGWVDSENPDDHYRQSQGCCAHEVYADTLTGKKCVDCGLETGGGE